MGETFYYAGQNWIVENYDDTSGKYICRGTRSHSYAYFTPAFIQCRRNGW